MNHSLAWLAAPEAAAGTPALLTGLVTDLRRILIHPELGPATKLERVANTLDQLAPPPPAEDNAPGAAAVAALLSAGADPATRVFEQLAGEPVRMKMVLCYGRLLSAAECQDLKADLGEAGMDRTGDLVTAGSRTVVAQVNSLVVTSRLPEDARRQLKTDRPLGLVLEDLGVRREPLGVRLVRGQDGRASVESSARMWLAGEPVALAGERIPAEFCQTVEGERRVELR